MSDKIISLEAFRKKCGKEKHKEACAGTEILIEFNFSHGAMKKLGSLRERLNAPNDNAVIGAAMEILRLCLNKMDEGRKIIAVDENGDGSVFFKDPHY